MLSFIASHWRLLVGIAIAFLTVLGPGAILGVLKIVPRWCWEVLIVLALLVTYGVYERGMGEATIQAKWDKEKAAQTKTKTAVAAKQNAVTTQTITQYIYRDRIVRVQGATITKQVPIYVTAQNDAQCTINNGFVRVWNAANTGVQLPDAAGDTDATTSRVVLSDVATQHSTESAYTRGLEVQLNSLQDWVEGQQGASRSPN